ncbi:MAG: hypothetical protein HC875_13490, partial [Anaerolineales bacterium]|nr:hypothetical protein [Anaerolineales bacterium]
MVASDWPAPALHRLAAPLPPRCFAATDRFLGINDFLVQRLTGQFCTDYSCGTEMLLADVSTGQWSQELCDLAGITPAHLPELRPSGVVIGPSAPT